MQTLLLFSSPNFVLGQLLLTESMRQEVIEVVSGSIGGVVSTGASENVWLVLLIVGQNF